MKSSEIAIMKMADVVPRKHYKMKEKDYVI